MDDLLQTSHFSSHQKKVFQYKSPFEWFLEADKVLGDYPCILAVLSEGITDLKWVEYIKQNIYRYKIELHGSAHLKYIGMSKDELLRDLSEAISKIEGTFGQKITTWYVPFGRKNIPTCGDEVCDILGIKMDRPTRKILPYYWLRYKDFNQVNWHYWDKIQIRQVEAIIQKWQIPTQ